MFIYTLVNIGSEKLLKEEVSIKYPHLKFAYSRPGYITFKDTTESFTVDTELNLIFARSYGLSLGKFSKDEIEAKISEYKDTAIIHRFSFVTEEYSGEKALLSKNVLDVMEIKEGEYWLGLRNVKFFSWFYPFANPHVFLPEESPSRSYLKLVESFIWTNFKADSSETVLELGSAPGGASYAMIERGMRVFGVDNGAMSETVLNSSLFTHIKEPMQRVRSENAPRPCHVLIADVNLTPRAMLPQINRFMLIRPSIKKVFYTLNIGEKITVPEIFEHLETFKSYGFRQVAATQLPSQKSEILFYGWR